MARPTMREWIALLNAKSWLAKQERDLTKGKVKPRYQVTLGR